MKIKRILSSALLAVMLFSVLIAAFPMAISAAYSKETVSTGATATADLSDKELKTYLSNYLGYSYETADEMLKDELEAGYLYSVNSANNLYSLYVNKYTGFVFYVNNVTGQILTSNPIDPSNTGEVQSLMSQIEIKFFESANTSVNKTYISHEWAAARSQISVSPISGGLRVNYTLGDTTPRFLVPGMITTENFDKYILTPMIEAYVDYLKEYCEDVLPDLNCEFFGNKAYKAYTEYGFINTSSASSNKGLKRFINDTMEAFKKAYSNTTKEYKGLFSINYAINTILTHYSLQNPARFEEGDAALDKMHADYPVTQDGTSIYVYGTGYTNVDKRIDSDNIKTYCPDYTFTMMYADEKACGYVDKSAQKPVFRCALEYSFNSDGSLSVRLPASSITFDETVYTLEYIKPLQYFGCADASRDGYIFFPDGSGSIIDFKDFYREGAGGKTNLSLSATPYGKDYCYSNITGIHRQQVTMPIYGLVTEVDANELTSKIYGKETVTNGYFAILEEGSALATLGVSSGGSTHKYGTAFASYNPYPSDKYDLSETITAGVSLGSYTIVSESKYTGSYVTRIVMLTDEEIGDDTYGKDAYYVSDYVGMASYYRNYLKNDGTLSALKLVSEDLPLYIEVLGAMDITTKVLSFPVTKSIALTSFDDVLTMYNELSKCKTLAKEKALENEKLALETDDEIMKAEYAALAKEYRALEAAVENISNINFRLTGFANGGMKFTYPAKLRWEKACGGEGGFENLVSESNAISADNGVNFGVFADFDFMYINNTAMFDGIGNKGNVSKMVDNRYASKQLYDNTLQDFESMFDLVISSDALDRLYGKFESKFTENGSNKISVSTLGSDLNSNFDDKNPINRDEARHDVIDLLDRMATREGYEVMTDVGNIYAVKYATHILNATIDSSHFRYSSYSIPFVGLVLHSYVNYTGTPLNYSGNVEYEILKSIESGAAPYYILCYQNSAYLKEDEELNRYYGVSYENWYDEIVKTYAKLNSVIGDLQDYELVYHSTVTAERVIEDEEMQVNYVILQNEIVELLDKQIAETVDAAFNELALGGAANYTKRLKLTVDRAALMAQFSEILNLPAAALEGGDFAKNVDALIAKYTSEYPGSENPENNYSVSLSALDYESQYSFITDSSAFDKDYVKTDYTIDNGNVTMVTYRKGNEEVTIFLNYNNYEVRIRLDADTVIPLDKFSYHRMPKEVK